MLYFYPFPPERVLIQPGNVTLSSIPRGDTDTKRNQDRSRATTSRFFFSEVSTSNLARFLSDNTWVHVPYCLFHRVFLCLCRKISQFAWTALASGLEVILSLGGSICQQCFTAPQLRKAIHINMWLESSLAFIRLVECWEIKVTKHLKLEIIHSKCYVYGFSSNLIILG